MIPQTVHVNVGEAIGALRFRFVIVANNHVAQSYTDFTDGYFVLLAWSVVTLVDLFATSSGTYAILELRIFQFPAVCPGVSTLAIIESPTCTAVPHSVPITDMIYISPFITAPAVHDPPVVGNVFGEASYPPR